MKLNKITTGLLLIITIIMLGAVMKAAANVLLPMIISIFLSLILAPVVNFLDRIHVPRRIAIVLIVLILFGVIFLIFLFFQTSINSLIAEYPKYAQRLQGIIREMSLFVEERFQISASDIFKDVDWGLTVRDNLVKLSGNLMNFVTSFIIIMIFLVFLLVEKPYFQKKLKVAFDPKTGKKLGEMIDHINRQVARYLSLKFVISMGTGILVWLALSLIGMDFSIVWGALAFVLNFIPSIGSSIHMAVTILMGFIQFYPSPGRIAAVMFSMVAIQTVIGQILDPRLQGHRLNLSPFVILFSLVIWGWIWGIVGMFLAVPIMAIIQIVCFNIPALRFIAVFISSGKVDFETQGEAEPISK